jgi:hypothetical protein
MSNSRLVDQVALLKEGLEASVDFQGLKISMNNLEELKGKGKGKVINAALRANHLEMYLKNSRNSSLKAAKHEEAVDSRDNHNQKAKTLL